MASTYSDLKIELIATGEQTGTWGSTTNTNLSTALGEAITGSADVAFSSADVTVTLTDTNAAQTARNLRLNLTGTSGGARQLILGSGCQIEKLYLVNNGLADAVTVKNTTGTGIAVPAGKTMFVYNNGTNVVDVTTHLSSLTLGTALPIASGGTGATSAPNAITALGATTLGGNVFTITNPSAITFPRFNANNTVSSLSAADFRTAIGAGTGGGDVAGPASATDNAIVRFDGTTGKLIQNSAVTIGDTGNTVIEVTDNTNAALRITQNGTGNAILVEDSTNPDSTPFVINSVGTVFVGSTVSAGSTSGGTTPCFQVIGTTNDTSAVASYVFENSQSTLPTFTGFKSRSATIGTQSLVSNGDTVLRLRGNGSDGASFLETARIDFTVDGTPGTSDMPGRLVFSTTPDGSATPTERMRIRSDGNIGFGNSGAAGVGFYFAKQITGGVTAYGTLVDTTVASTVTTSARSFQSTLGTQAAAFTVTDIQHYSANQGTIGAGSAVTTQFGFNATSSLIGATNNYGFYGNIASGTGRWNFYAAGTAENYLGGNLKVGSTAARGTTAGTNHLSIFNGTAPAGTLTNGITLYSASGDLNFMDSSGNGYQVGYRNIPQVSQSAAYTLVLGDSGEHIFHPSADTTARTWTIPANGTVAFPIGTAVTFINQNGAGVITIAITTDTMRLAGAGTTGNRTLAANGIATAIKITSTEWIISGTGLT